ncbi:phospholipase D-like domain-containing protein [Chryseolinea sp. T2]|uniref:phospholipase D-like domain-containing protein n=1 Tax=Chryseolinea sp. T2 TaxID=3129255 RepID=UPI0030785545
MDQIIEYLHASTADDFLSKQEKRTLKELIADHPLDANQINVIRSKVFEIASQKANGENVQFVLDWVKSTTSALQTPLPDLDAYFSPGDTCRNAITKQISTASQNLLVCVFTISDDIITESLIAAHRRGVTIRLITDNEKSFDKGSDIAQLAREGIELRMDTSPNHMHHKFMVVDKHSVLTGSYNWTRGAARFNHENIIVTKDPGTVRAFTHEFEKLWPTMAPYDLR